MLSMRHATMVGSQRTLTYHQTFVLRVALILVTASCDSTSCGVYPLLDISSQEDIPLDDGRNSPRGLGERESPLDDGSKDTVISMWALRAAHEIRSSRSALASWFLDRTRDGDVGVGSSSVLYMIHRSHGCT